GIRDFHVTGVQTCALPISHGRGGGVRLADRPGGAAGTAPDAHDDAVAVPARPLRVGLTGNIGSGKSTVARLLQELGAAVIDADRSEERRVGKEGRGWWGRG